MRRSVFALAALSLWQSCTAQVNIETLVPYNPPSVDVSKRDAQATAVTLQDALSLIWKSQKGSTFVNVTLNTGDTELVISTENFIDSLTDVQCQGDLVLTFKDNATFQDAIANWSWVNFHENRTLVMINNWGACAASSASGRQPWIVHGVDVYDEQKFIVNFNATLLSDWDSVMSGAVIEFGSIPSTSTKRGDLDTIGQASPLGLAYSLPQDFFGASTNNGLNFSINCLGCATTGSMEILGKIVMNTNSSGSPIGVNSISINATPKGLGANFDLEFGFSGTLGSGWSEEWNLITVGLAGWTIPGILTLGPQFSVDAGFSLSGIKGAAQVGVGIGFTIPDSSSALLGIDGGNSSSQGWVPTVTLGTPKVSVQVSGQLELYTQLGLDVGLTVLNKYGFGAGIFLKVPDVEISLGALFNTQGACAGSADVLGVRFDLSVGVDLGLGVYTEAGGKKDWQAQTTIYENNNIIKPIDKCFPIDPAPSGTPSASASSTKAPSSTASPTVTRTKTATGTITPTPTSPGIFSICNKWVIVENTTSTCQSIADTYGITLANLLAWNPALGSACKLTIGQSLCVGTQSLF
ncbi:hypothetical protein DSL72_001856 [Monilinia vaccinii-corymbosi]|uniref:LysM domain-containing protein n=1 Tax=Monilinia vaccinii-corymbosi TaxID=61207 RepID=A0A8A3PAZ0_9HELO|nr:hypothetical protein DSL72_001856 [Monilinia vaccinii-corymbosi]